MFKCSSFVITSASEITNTPKDPICNLKPGTMESRQVKNKMKEKALTTTNYMTIASTVQDIQNDMATQMNMPPQEFFVKDSLDTRQNLQMHCRTYPMEKISKLLKIWKYLLLSLNERMNPKFSSYLS